MTSSTLHRLVKAIFEIDFIDSSKFGEVEPDFIDVSKVGEDGTEPSDSNDSSELGEDGGAELRMILRREEVRALERLRTCEPGSEAHVASLALLEDVRQMLGF